MNEFIEKHKQNAHKILMITGLIIFVLFSIYTKVNDIDTNNTWSAFIGFVIFGLPFFSGLWIYSNKIENDRKALRIIIKSFIIFFTFILCVSFIIFLVQWIKLSYESDWLQIVAIIVPLAIILLIVLVILKKNRKSKYADTGIGESKFSKVTNYLKTMNNKWLRFTFLIIGVALVIAGVTAFVGNASNDFEGSMTPSILLYCTGISFMGIFLLFISKDLKEKKKTLSIILKILALYWIISGEILTVIGILQVIFMK